MTTNTTTGLLSSTSAASAAAAASAASSTASTTSTSTTSSLTGGQTVSKDEFLQMLVTQLKNQDPENPMNSDQFAVNLAQFSQLEQLVSINGKLGAPQGSDASSLAGYLGREVYTKGDGVDVSGGNGGSVKFTLPGGAASASLDILDSGGNVVKSTQLGTLSPGPQTIDLKNLSVPDGSYKVKVNVTGYSGITTNPDTTVGGVVTGFIPGANPTLLVGNNEVKTADIQFVGVAGA